ncbi:aldo/keto reductase [Stenoxybacter acetivorans]|uniref:aldo/keto reductase n=1 Tax=Stenoxybacter acetivorans TaxID=422441 RepID=UPI0005692D73|nr:aldo/keto reductase [Stenoxybacter acetivorans]
MEYVTLNNGVKMPVLGYGVFQVPDLSECERCVLDAIDVGYRSIDTAQSYMNEAAVGNAIAKCGVARGELFITTKMWISNYGYEKAKKAIDNSLSKLQTDYVDLFLLHQPFSDVYGAYRALEEAYKAGKIRAIGVSNFYPDRLADIASFSEIKPQVNQIETHVFQQQKFAREVLLRYGVQAEAWAPFAEGKNDFFTNSVLGEIGAKYGKTVGQAALRFLIQSGVVVIPKSVRKERMAENFDVFDFTLSEGDMREIEKLDKGDSLFFRHDTPEAVEMFVGLIKERGSCS